MTNGDKIRAMSDSEYANWLCDHLICGDCLVYEKCGKESRKHGGWDASADDCFNRLLGWLRSPVLEGKYADRTAGQSSAPGKRSLDTDEQKAIERMMSGDWGF